jgi:arginyl-tRNA synthetase
LELAGYITSPEEAVHVAYGFLTLPEGAMSTRKGTVVGATEFIKNVQTEALRIIEEKNPDLSEKEIVAKKVAAAALKYFDLSHNLKSDIVFDPKTAISFEGNTGPYLQYTHARIHGILRKVSDDLKPSDRNKIPASAGMTFKTEDFLVLRKLSKFPEVVEQVASELLPNLLCNYLFELSQNFNTFYEKAPILSETDENLKAFRLQLISATAQVLNNGLFLLGIDAPEEM